MGVALSRCVEVPFGNTGPEISSGGQVSFKRIWNYHEERIHFQLNTSSPYLTNWSNDGVLLLSRMEVRIAQEARSNHDSEGIKSNQSKSFDEIGESMMSVGSSGAGEASQNQPFPQLLDHFPGSSAMPLTI